MYTGCFRKGHLAPVCLCCGFTYTFLCRSVQGACRAACLRSGMGGAGWVCSATTQFQARLKIARVPLPSETQSCLGPSLHRDSSSHDVGASPIATASSRSPVVTLWSWDRGGVQKPCFHYLPLQSRNNLGILCSFGYLPPSQTSEPG